MGSEAFLMCVIGQNAYCVSNDGKPLPSNDCVVASVKGADFQFLMDFLFLTVSSILEILTEEGRTECTCRLMYPVVLPSHCSDRAVW